MAGVAVSASCLRGSSSGCLPTFPCGRSIQTRASWLIAIPRRGVMSAGDTGAGPLPAHSPREEDESMAPLSRLRPTRVLVVGVVLGLAALAGVLATRGSAVPPGPTFAPPVYVDQTLAGGEPEGFADSKHGTIIYTAHA